MFNKLHLAFQGRVKMIFNVVVSATGEVLGDLRPSVAQLLVSLNDEHVLLLGPLVLLDVRVQVIVPPFYCVRYELSSYLSRHCLPILPGRAVAI